MLFSLAIVFKSFSPLSSSMTNSFEFCGEISSCSRHKNDPSFYSAYSIPDSLKNVSQKSVLNYDTIIVQ